MKRCLALVALVLIAACAPDPSDDSDYVTQDLRQAARDAGFDACIVGTTSRVDGVPDLDLLCLDGETTVNLARVDARPLVVNLWASWCAPCREELPHLAQADEDYADVTFLGIMYEDPDPHAAIELAERSGVRYMQAVDPRRLVREPLGVIALPQTIFIDEDGVVTIERRAYRSYDDLASDIERHLGVTP